MLSGWTRRSRTQESCYPSCMFIAIRSLLRRAFRLFLAIVTLGLVRPRPESEGAAFDPEGRDDAIGWVVEDGDSEKR